MINLGAAVLAVTWDAIIITVIAGVIAVLSFGWAYQLRREERTGGGNGLT